MRRTENLPIRRAGECPVRRNYGEGTCRRTGGRQALRDPGVRVAPSPRRRRPDARRGVRNLRQRRRPVRRQAQRHGPAVADRAGHEPVGVIEEIGAEAARRWGLKKGDRVAVEPGLGCGHCRDCIQGNFRRCRVGRPGTKIVACGFVPTHIPPSLWGGMAEYMYLDPHAALHKVSRDIPAELAALYQPMAAGISWAYYEPHTRVGDTGVLWGAGQRGLACVVGAREAGAAQVIVIARRQSEHRLALAKELGADVALYSEDDVVARVRELTHGEGADVVIDVTAQVMEPITKAVEIAKQAGTIVLAGVKGWGAMIPGLENDRIFYKELTIKGVRNSDYRSFEVAIKLIESRKYQ